MCDNLIKIDQIVHHNPYFNLFILHDNLFGNQGSDIYIKDYIDFKYTKNQLQKPKIEPELLFGLIHLSTKQYPQMFQNFFFDWSTDSLID